jgi:spermidine synthase
MAGDLIYYVEPAPSGRALVIGSAGGREVVSALAHGHQQVDVVVADAQLANGAWLGVGREKTAGLFDDPERVRILVGDGRTTVARAPDRSYQRIIVARSEHFTANPLRVLPVERRYTSEAMQAYFRALDDHGAMLLEVPVASVPAVLAAAKAALGGHGSMLRRRTYVCSNKKGKGAVVLVHATDIDAKMRHKLKKRCRRARLTLDYPLEQVRKGHRDFEKRKRERDAAMARMESGVAASDDRPFVVSPARATLKQDVLSTLRALSPETLLRRGRRVPRPRVVASKVAAQPKPAAQPQPAAVEPQVTPFALAVMTFGATLLIAFVVWLLPHRREDGASVVPRSLRWSLPLFGVALASGVMLVVDVLTVHLGTSAATYSLLLPVSLAGAAAGRVLADGPSDPRELRGVLLSAVVAMGVVLPFAFGDPLLIAALHSIEGFELVVAGTMALVAGAALGHPFAAALRAVAADSSVAVASAWAAHRMGWVLAVAASMVIIQYVGVSALGMVASLATALGTALFLFGVRHAPAR